MEGVYDSIGRGGRDDRPGRFFSKEQIIRQAACPGAGLAGRPRSGIDQGLARQKV